MQLINSSEKAGTLLSKCTGVRFEPVTSFLCSTLEYFGLTDFLFTN